MSSLVRGGGCNRPTVTYILSYYFLYSFPPYFFLVFVSSSYSPFCIVFSIAFPFVFLQRNSFFPFPNEPPRWQRTAVFDQPRCVLSLSPGQRKQTNETIENNTHTHVFIFHCIVCCSNKVFDQPRCVLSLSPALHT